MFKRAIIIIGKISVILTVSKIVLFDILITLAVS